MKKIIQMLKTKSAEKKQERLNIALAKAVEKNDLKKGESLLKQGADPNFRLYDFLERPLEPGTVASMYYRKKGSTLASPRVERSYLYSSLLSGASHEFSNLLEKYGCTSEDSVSIRCTCLQFGNTKCTCRQKLDDLIEHQAKCAKTAL